MTIFNDSFRLFTIQFQVTSLVRMKGKQKNTFKINDTLSVLIFIQRQNSTLNI